MKDIAQIEQLIEASNLAPLAKEHLKTLAKNFLTCRDKTQSLRTVAKESLDMLEEEAHREWLLFANLTDEELHRSVMRQFAKRAYFEAAVLNLYENHRRIEASGRDIETFIKSMGNTKDPATNIALLTLTLLGLRPEAESENVWVEFRSSKLAPRDSQCAVAVAFKHALNYRELIGIPRLFQNPIEHLACREEDEQLIKAIKDAKSVYSDYLAKYTSFKFAKSEQCSSAPLIEYEVLKGDFLKVREAKRQTLFIDVNSYSTAVHLLQAAEKFETTMESFRTFVRGFATSVNAQDATNGNLIRMANCIHAQHLIREMETLSTACASLELNAHIRSFDGKITHILEA